MQNNNNNHSELQKRLTELYAERATAQSKVANIRRRATARRSEATQIHAESNELFAQCDEIRKSVNEIDREIAETKQAFGGSYVSFLIRQMELELGPETASRLRQEAAEAQKAFIAECQALVV